MSAFKKINIQDPIYLKRVVQVIKPILVKEEAVNTRTLLLNNTKKAIKPQPQSADIAFNSLLHKSAVSKSRNSLGYEETFNIYNK